jgi:hypothetical protein
MPVVGCRTKSAAPAGRLFVRAVAGDGRLHSFNETRGVVARCLAAAFPPQFKR